MEYNHRDYFVAVIVFFLALTALLLIRELLPSTLFLALTAFLLIAISYDNRRRYRVSNTGLMMSRGMENMTANMNTVTKQTTTQPHDNVISGDFNITGKQQAKIVSSVSSATSGITSSVQTVPATPKEVITSPLPEPVAPQSADKPRALLSVVQTTPNSISAVSSPIPVTSGSPVTVSPLPAPNDLSTSSSSLAPAPTQPFLGSPIDYASETIIRDGINNTLSILRTNAINTIDKLKCEVASRTLDDVVDKKLLTKKQRDDYWSSSRCSKI